MGFQLTRWLLPRTVYTGSQCSPLLRDAEKLHQWQRTNRGSRNKNQRKGFVQSVVQSASSFTAVTASPSAFREAAAHSPVMSSIWMQIIQRCWCQMTSKYNFDVIFGASPFPRTMVLNAWVYSSSNNETRSALLDELRLFVHVVYSNKGRRKCVSDNRHVSTDVTA